MPVFELVTLLVFEYLNLDHVKAEPGEDLVFGWAGLGGLVTEVDPNSFDVEIFDSSSFSSFSLILSIPLSTSRFLLPYSSSFFSVEFSEPSTEEAKNLQNIEIPFTHAYMNTVN